MKTPIWVASTLLVPLLLVGCIGNDFIEDFIEPTVRITNPLDTLGVGETYQLEAAYFNNVGQQETVDFAWSSDAPEIVSVDASGLLTGVSIGTAIITVEARIDDSTSVETLKEVRVGESTTVSATERTGTIQTTTFYTLEGDFVLKENGEDLVLEIAENWEASSNLPGLYVYMTNNPSTTNGALEIGPVSVFSGAHSYTLPDGVGLNDYDFVLYFCKPFNVKVGDGTFDN